MSQGNSSSVSWNIIHMIPRVFARNIVQIYISTGQEEPSPDHRRKRLRIVIMPLSLMHQSALRVHCKQLLSKNPLQKQNHQNGAIMCMKRVRGRLCIIQQKSRVTNSSIINQLESGHSSKKKEEAEEVGGRIKLEGIKNNGGRNKRKKKYRNELKKKNTVEYLKKRASSCRKKDLPKKSKT